MADVYTIFTHVYYWMYIVVNKKLFRKRSQQRVS